MLIAVAPLVLEGDYAAWTLAWESVNAVVSVTDALCVPSSFNAIETIVLVHSGFEDMAVITVATGVFTEYVNYSDGATEQNQDRSVLGTYQASIYAPTPDELRIWKDGALIQTINRDAALDEFRGVVVSPSGRYILVLYYDNSDGDEKFRLYEGA